MSQSFADAAQAKQEEPIHLLLAESQPLLRATLATALAQDTAFHQVTTVATFAELCQAIAEQQPDMLLVSPNIQLPVPLPMLRQQLPPVAATLKIVALLDQLAERCGYKLAEAGFAGCVTKAETAVALLEALHTVASGQSWFSRTVLQQLLTTAPRPSDITAQEREILQRLAAGETNRHIARQLHVAERTLYNYLATIYHKLNVSTRAEAIVYAAKAGLLE